MENNQNKETAKANKTDEYKAYRNEISKRYYQRNKDKLKEAYEQRKLEEGFKEKSNTSSKAYYYNNLDKIRARYQVNKDNDEFKHKMKENNKKQYAKLKDKLSSLTAEVERLRTNNPNQK